MNTRMPTSFRLGLVQLDSGADKDANVETACGWIEKAAEQGAQCIALPEVFDVIDDDSEPAEIFPSGSTLRRLSLLARKHSVWIHAGSLKEADGDKKPFNTSVLFNAEGEAVAKYRKLHRFDVTLPDGTQIRESDSIREGKEIVTADTPFGVFGMSICYDLRFPELYRTLRLQGADVLFVPSNFTETTGKDHWEALLRARAIENGCYVVAAAQSGRKYHGRASYGHSMVVDPWGAILTRIEEGVGMRVVTLEADALIQARERLPFSNRRDDIWPLSVSDER